MFNWFWTIFSLGAPEGKLEVITSFGVYVPIMVYVYFGPWMYFIKDPICCKFGMVLSMFSRMILENPLDFLFETSTWHLDSWPSGDTWYGVILWLNTVLRTVSGNSRESMCFKLDKQTWYTDDDFSRSTY